MIFLLDNAINETLQSHKLKPISNLLVREHMRWILQFTIQYIGQVFHTEKKCIYTCAKRIYN